MKMCDTRRRFLSNSSQPCSNCGTSNIAVSCLIALFAVQIVSCQDPCSSGPCYPSPSDISGKFNVTANSTCGDPPQTYCVNLNCSNVCNASDQNKHPPSFVKDGFSLNTFWKAKNYEFPVVLQLDIGRTFMLYQSVVTFYHELPAAMYLLKSNDSGITYRPITYFATNCTRFFNMPETLENDREGLKVQCFKIDPGENPSLQLYYSPLRDPDAAQNVLTDTEKQAFFLMTNLKMVLVNFITTSQFNPNSVPESIKRSFYFAVSDWDVLASCFCNGQASECDLNDVSKCICKRNTDGYNCEKCLPLFNNRPYRTREACEACECNNHAASCTYNETKGFGVCDSCTDNTTGDHCDRCRRSFYRNPAVPQNHSNTCLPCNCDVTGANETSCHPDTGQCSCRENVTGLQCNRCLTNYYNFNNGAGCSPCNCHAVYSSSLQCDGNSGVCSCKPGINGGKCTACADQFYNLTDQGCRSCECNNAGSNNLVCEKTTGQCPCRAHSLGHQCDTCPSGFYGLNANHSEGCLKCQCSNKSSICASDAGWLVSEITTNLSVFLDNTKVDDWTAVNSAGSSVAVVLDWGIPVQSTVKGSMRVDTSGSEDVYFVAPAKYLGDQRFAYTFTLTFKLQQDNAASPARSSRGDVILEGMWFNEPLVTSLSTPPPEGNIFRKYEVKFVESDWKVGNTSGRQPTSYEMIVVLSHVTSLHIRAKWTSLTTQLDSRLGDIVLLISNRTNVITPPKNAYNVERCSCPSEYKGQFCEQCTDGYTRSIPNGGPYVTCVPCLCNNHSDTCHPETGVCQNCLHNTTGEHCEKCTDGWYGNATNATPQDCSPCPCPGGPFAPNQFANTCVLGSDGLPTCVNCSHGHQGRSCEICMDGYFGRPWEQNGQCHMCECNNNTDLGATGNCNTTTGECLKCLYNTTGFNCEWCASEYHGNALNITCTPILALLGSRIQVTQTSNATLSPTSLVSPSSKIMQHNKTASSATLYATKMIYSTTNINTSFVPFTSSMSSRRKSSSFAKYTKTVTLSETIALPTMTISVTQSNFTSTPVIPTATPTTVKGLPDVKVIAAIAGILGAILLILFGIIVWSLCIVQTLERRPSSRVQPSEMSQSVSELV